MLFAAFWLATGVALGAFIWLPVSIAAMKKDMAEEVERRVRMALRYGARP